MIIDPHEAESLSGKAMQMSDPYLVTNGRCADGGICFHQGTLRNF